LIRKVMIALVAVAVLVATAFPAFASFSQVPKKDFKKVEKKNLQFLGQSNEQAAIIGQSGGQCDATAVGVAGVEGDHNTVVGNAGAASNCPTVNAAVVTQQQANQANQAQDVQGGGGHDGYDGIPKAAANSTHPDDGGAGFNQENNLTQSASTTLVLDVDQSNEQKVIPVQIVRIGEILDHNNE